MDNPDPRRRLLLKSLAAAGLTLATSSARPLTAQEPPPRVFWLGVNYPWWNFGQDFGDPRLGVAANFGLHEARFADLSSRGARVVRWWVFPDLRTAGPGGFQEQVYVDLDAAIELARRYDVYLHFTLLNNSEIDRLRAPGFVRGLVDRTLTPLLQRYGGEPRIVSWDPMNEPDWAIDRDGSRLAPFRAYAGAVVALVRAYTGQAVTVGSGWIRFRRWYRDLGLDYYTFHRYNTQARDPANDVLRRPADAWDLDRPIVVGELQDSDSDTPDRYNLLFDAGYSGVWPWSYNSEITHDHLQVDWDSLTQFAVMRGGEFRTP